MPSPEVVIALDVGTTNARAAAFDVEGACQAAASRELPLPAGGLDRAEQDPKAVVEASLDVLARTVAQVRGRGASPAGLCLSTAMHGLIGLDAQGRPLTPLITWADRRAEVQARRLRLTPGAAALSRRTGAPLHAMTPLAKLLWFREEEPDTFARVARWASPKELLLHRLLGSPAVDHSVAGATGLFNLERRDWDDGALAMAGVPRERLGELVAPTCVLRGLDAEVARAMGLDPATPVVAGASDGALANLGAGAITPGIAACTVGTSGAVRLASSLPRVDPGGRLFCYPLTLDRWVVGGAVNDGGICLRWLRDGLLSDVRDAARARGQEPYAALTELAAAAPAGADGLFFLPGLSGERAPQRVPSARGVLFGLTLGHGRAHLVRAVMEGVMLQLRGVARLLAEAGLPLREVRANGGFARSALWLQIMADVFAAPIRLTGTAEASALGAALLGMTALGWFGSVDEAAARVQVTATVPPSKDAELYADHSAGFDRLVRALDPLFETPGGP